MNSGRAKVAGAQRASALIYAPFISGQVDEEIVIRAFVTLKVDAMTEGSDA